ncbi:MAG: hypothetical protein K8T89_25695 [Planctomycetes bacterium]|nr:hypothetical protein [Planctomycetota bacterium]
MSENSAADDPEQPEPLGAGFDFSSPNSPLAPYFLNASHVVGIVILCGICSFYSLVPLWHTDVWGHVFRGEAMVSQYALPDREPFTPFADSEQPAIHVQWASQAGYALLMQLGGTGSARSDPQRALENGVELLRVFHWLLVSSRFFLFWFAARRISGSVGWANFAVLVLFLALLNPTATQRPQAIGMLLFTVLFLMLSRPALSRRSMFAMPILFVLWANLHGTFIVGLAYLAFFTVARFIQIRLSESGSTWRASIRQLDFQRLFLALMFSIVGVAILNPHGPMLYWYVITFSDRPNVRDLNEWRPLLFRAGPGPHWIYIFSWILIFFLWVLSRFSKIPYVVAALPFGVWPLFQERAMIWWLMLTPWLFAALAPIVARRFHWDERFSVSSPSFRKTILAGGVFCLFLLWIPPVQWLLRGKPQILEKSASAATCWRLGLELQASPETRGRWMPALANALKTYPEGRFQGRIFSSESLGDYLFRVVPRGAEVMIGTHAHVFPVAHWRTSMAIKYALGDWRGWLAARRANLVVIEPDLYPELAKALRADPDWQVVEDESNTNPRRLGDRKFIALRKSPL